MQYENRLIVYIDILGFKQAIARTLDTNDETRLEINSICEMFSLIKKHWRVAGTAKISQFSDVIVLSLLPYEGVLVETLFMLQVFIFQLLHKGFLCRGTIKYGKLIHTDEYLFGPVLVEAYQEERDLVKFPRIIIHPNVFMIDLSFYDDGYQKVLKDEDSLHYLDYFQDIDEILLGLKITDGFYCFTLWRAICEGLTTHKESPVIRKKYEWMKKKYNEAATLAKAGTWYKQLPVNV